eukprot:SAG31_NODE_3488_length_4207_cov_3.508277_3_plen_238_part_00
MACSSGCVLGALWFMQHWPYVDSTMMSEGYDYDAPAAGYYLIELNSLAWGIGNDMCCNGPPKVWRGMVFGMVSRYDVGMCDAYGMRTTHPPNKTAMWILWDDFDLLGASMVGYWHPNPLVKIASQHLSSNCSEVYVCHDAPDVGQRALVAIGSWQPSGVQHCSLEVDWAGLGFRTTQYVWRVVTVWSSPGGGFRLIWLYNVISLHSAPSHHRSAAPTTGGSNEWMHRSLSLTSTAPR